MEAVLFSEWKTAAFVSLTRGQPAYSSELPQLNEVATRVNSDPVIYIISTRHWAYDPQYAVRKNIRPRPGLL